MDSGLGDLGVAVRSFLCELSSGFRRIHDIETKQLILLLELSRSVLVLTHHGVDTGRLS